MEGVEALSRHFPVHFVTPVKLGACVEWPPSEEEEEEGD